MHHASAIDDNGSYFCYYHITAFWAKLSHVFNIKVLKFRIVSCYDGNDSQSYNEKDMPLFTPGLTLEMLIENEGSGLVMLCSRVAVG